MKINVKLDIIENNQNIKSNTFEKIQIIII